MSHFTVMVIGDNPHEQLAPYQENNMGDCPEEYLEFHDVEEEYRKKYEEDSSPEFFNEGSSYPFSTVPDSIWNIIKSSKVGDEFTLNLNKEEMGPFNYFKLNGKYKVGRSGKQRYKWLEVIDIIQTNHPNPDVCFEGIVAVKIISKPKEIRLNQMYDTFEEYMEDYCGYKEKDKKTGRYGYWENPQRKWDWYQIGGRWSGFFKLKENAAGILGKPGIFNNDPEFDADQVLKKDIDIEGMRNDAEEKAIKRYEAIEKVFNGEIPKLEHLWSDLCDNEDLNWDERKKIYNAQPGLKKWEKIKKQYWDKDGLEHDLLVWGSLDDFQVSKEKYIEDARNSAMIPFAVVKDSKWYEKGEMGWWAAVSNEKDKNDWQVEVNKLIDECPDDTLFTLVDCHI